MDSRRSGKSHDHLFTRYAVIAYAVIAKTKKTAESQGVAQCLLHTHLKITYQSHSTLAG